MNPPRGYTHGFPWHTKDKAWFEDLVRRFGTAVRIAEHLGVDPAVVSCANRNTGWNVPFDSSRRSKRPSILDAHKNEILALASEGLHARAIAERLGLPVKGEQVRRRLHRWQSEDYIGRDWSKGDGNPMWHGGRQQESNGYILIYTPDHPCAKANGTVYEHRLVMEEALGRTLNPEEVVHHINGVRDDNRSENLMLFADNAEHLQYEWANPIWAEHQSVVRQKDHADTPSPQELENDAAG